MVELEFKGLLICVPLYTVGVLVLGASISASLFVFHIAVVPLIFKYSKAFRRSLIFANFIQWPLHTDFEEPASAGIDGARNLSIEYESKVDKCRVKIGIWHILPKTAYERLKGNFDSHIDKEELNRILDEELATSKSPVVLYCHGNSNSRAATHRIELYKFFQKMEFHAITFDYRGYGDSTNLRPTEAGVVEDSLVVYEWLHTTLNGNKNIFVWGHSLGTAISSHLLGNLQELSVRLLERPAPLPPPRGLILEAPFNNLADEVAKHPLSRLVTWLPYYDYTFVEPFRSNNEQTFKSDEHLTKVKSLPILILHAKDDVVVPFVVGLRLYRSVVQSRSDTDAPIKLHAYPSEHDLGHKWICHAPDLPDIIAGLLLAGASVTASLIMVQVAVLPLVFKYSKSVQRKIVFSNCINYPRNLDYKNPSSCNVVGGRHFNIEFNSIIDNCPIKLGVWHIVPCSMFREVFVIRDYLKVDAHLHEELKKTKNTVVLYCHGNSNHRASPHRLQMYKVFQELNFHVITFDYRGYGDSTHIRPTEKGVVEDALAVYAWLMESLSPTDRPTVLIWGHSLGTAVAANMTAHLSELCHVQGHPQLPCPDALVLEAPFNNLMDEITSHPFAKLVSWLPYYKDTFVKPFTASSEYSFDTDQYLCSVPHIPILMMHSKGDKIVPYNLACKLHDKVKASRAKSGAPLVFHTFERGCGLGHNNLCQATNLKDVVGSFLAQIKTDRSS